MDCEHIHSCLTGCPAQRLHAYGKTLDDLYDEYGDPLCPLMED
jgi:radical SAM protein with 4Fe4S-binding SPASM domain